MPFKSSTKNFISGLFRSLAKLKNLRVPKFVLLYIKLRDRFAMQSYSHGLFRVALMACPSPPIFQFVSLQHHSLHKVRIKYCTLNIGNKKIYANLYKTSIETKLYISIKTNCEHCVMDDAVRQATSTMGQKEAILNIDHKKARASSLLVFASGHGALFQRQCEVRIVPHWTCCLVHEALLALKSFCATFASSKSGIHKN